MKELSPLFEHKKVGDTIHVAYISSDTFEMWEKPINSIRPCCDGVGFSLRIVLDYIPNVGKKIDEDYVVNFDEDYVVTANKSSSIQIDEITNSSHTKEEMCCVVATTKEVLEKTCRNILDVLREESFRRAVNYEKHLTKI